VCFTVNCSSIELKFAFAIPPPPPCLGTPARHPMGTNSKARSRDRQVVPFFFVFFLKVSFLALNCQNYLSSFLSKTPVGVNC